jgi:hypothetical protein
MWTRWDCEHCKAGGSVQHKPDSGVWEVLDTIWNKHTDAAYRNGCEYGPEGICVRIDADRMYPVPKRARKSNLVAAEERS